MGLSIEELVQEVVFLLEGVLLHGILTVVQNIKDVRLGFKHTDSLMELHFSLHSQNIDDLRVSHVSIGTEHHGNVGTGVLDIDITNFVVLSHAARGKEGRKCV